MNTVKAEYFTSSICTVRLLCSADNIDVSTTLYLLDDGFPRALKYNDSSPILYIYLLGIFENILYLYN